MANGEAQMTKGVVIVKLSDTQNLEFSKINLTRKHKPTPNSGDVSVTKIIEGKGFRISSTSKRDNGTIIWSLNN